MGLDLIQNGSIRNLIIKLYETRLKVILEDNEIEADVVMNG